jgi:hypothetical protein
MAAAAVAEHLVLELAAVDSSQVVLAAELVLVIILTIRLQVVMEMLLDLLVKEAMVAVAVTVS